MARYKVVASEVFGYLKQSFSTFNEYLAFMLSLPISSGIVGIPIEMIRREYGIGIEFTIGNIAMAVLTWGGFLFVFLKIHPFARKAFRCY